MRRFVSSFLVFGVCVAVAVLGMNYISNRLTPIRFGDEVFTAIRLSGLKNPTARSVLLGDSVANQLFNPSKYQGERPSMTYLTSNQALTPAGNLVLLKRYLVANPQTREVIYMARPSSIQNCGDIAYTFHYLIYPFAETGLIDQVDDGAMGLLKRRFGAFVFSSSALRRILYSDDYFYSAYESWVKMRSARVQIPMMGELPKVCIDCIREMSRICKEKDIRFKVISSPLKQDNADRYSELTRSIVKELSLAGADQYKVSQVVFPNEYFHRDGVHFKNDAHRAEIVQAVFSTIGGDF